MEYSWLLVISKFSHVSILSTYRWIRIMVYNKSIQPYKRYNYALEQFKGEVKKIGKDPGYCYDIPRAESFSQGQMMDTPLTTEFLPQSYPSFAPLGWSAFQARCTVDDQRLRLSWSLQPVVATQKPPSGSDDEDMLDWKCSHLNVSCFFERKK